MKTELSSRREHHFHCYGGVQKSTFFRHLFREAPKASPGASFGSPGVDLGRFWGPLGGPWGAKGTPKKPLKNDQFLVSLGGGGSFTRPKIMDFWGGPYNSTISSSFQSSHQHPPTSNLQPPASTPPELQTPPQVTPGWGRRRRLSL